jgi:hypothetical protein
MKPIACAERTCRTCRFFENRPLAIERGLPALASLSSAHGSSRSDDGLCLRHDRYMRAAASCTAYAA